MVATVGPSRFCEDGKALLLSSAERKGGNPGNRAPVPRGSLTTNSSFPSHRLLREPSSLLSQNPRGGNDFHAHVIPFSSVRTEQSSSGSPAGGAFYGHLICGRAWFSPCRMPFAALRFPHLMTVTVKQATFRTEEGCDAAMKATENAVRDRQGFARLTLVIVLIFAVMGASICGRLEEDLRRHGRCRHSEPQRELEPRAKARWRPFMDSEAQFQRLLATELAAAGDPAAAVRSAWATSDAAALHLRRARGRADVGVSNDGEPPFDPASARLQRRGSHRGAARLAGLCERRGQRGPTRSKCPIERDGVPIAGTLYTEYTFDAIDQSLPVRASTASGPCSISWTPPRSASC